MRIAFRYAALLVATMTGTSMFSHGQATLLAKGLVLGTPEQPYADLSGFTDTLENGAKNNLLGGLGSGLARVKGTDTFVAIPDRGPNAMPYNPLVDDTASYINRFQTIKMNLQFNKGSGLPLTINPVLSATTPFYSTTPLVYGSGAGLNVPNGAPAENTKRKFFFTGRSDNYDPDQNSGDVRDARLDPEGVRVSPDGLFLYVSDEYGPYIYQFLRATGERVQTFRVPKELYVANPRPTGAGEIANNNAGRTPNKGFEGLALTPNGRTLVAILQAATIDDAAEGGAAANLLRMVAIDTTTGRIKGEYAYELTTGSGVSDLVALNNHEFIVDERDGKGLGDGSSAKVKQFFKIDLKGAFDVRGLSGTQAATHAVTKTLFIDLVKVLTAAGFTPTTIPAKIEGLAFGPEVTVNGVVTHTLFVANDNDFVLDYGGVAGSNPNQIFVVGFTDKDLNGSVYNPQ